jgi:sugar phosphate isomerase/epimerase
MGLATFVPSTIRGGLRVESSSFQKKLSRVPHLMEVLEKNGFDFVEAETSLLSPEGDPEDFKLFKEKMNSFTIKPEVFSAFIPPDLKVVGPAVDEKRLKRYLAVSMHRVADVGGEMIIWGSGSSRSYPKDYSREDASQQVEAFLQWAADLAEADEIRLAIEPMNKRESNMINSLKEGMDLVNRINRQEIRVMLDYYHFMMEERELSNIEACRGKIIHVHISDSDRTCPGDGHYSFNALFNLLKKIDYRDRISFECNFRKYEIESKRALTLARDIWEHG